MCWVKSIFQPLYDQSWLLKSFFFPDPSDFFLAMILVVLIINTTWNMQSVFFFYLACFLHLLHAVIFQAGGLLGGAAVSWLIGPAWELQSVARDGRRIFEDRAPIFNLTRRHPKWMGKSFTILDGWGFFEFFVHSTYVWSIIDRL